MLYVRIHEVAFTGVDSRSNSEKLATEYVICVAVTPCLGSEQSSSQIIGTNLQAVSTKQKGKPKPTTHVALSPAKSGIAPQSSNKILVSKRNSHSPVEPTESLN